MTIDFCDFEEDGCKVLKIAHFTSDMSCGILGCSSEKRYKTTLPDLKLWISRKNLCLLNSALSVGIGSKLFIITFKLLCSLEDILFPTFKKRWCIWTCFHQSSHINRSCWFCSICLKAVDGVKYKIIFGEFFQLLELLFEVMKVGHQSCKKDLCRRYCWWNISTIFPFYEYCCYSAVEWVVENVERKWFLKKNYLQKIAGTLTDCCKVRTVYLMQ